MTGEELGELKQLRDYHKDGVKRRRGWSLPEMQQEYARFVQLNELYGRKNGPGSSQRHVYNESQKIAKDLYWLVHDEEEKLERRIKGECPIGFFQPSYEQAQMLNFWHPDFDPEYPQGRNTCLNFGGVRCAKSWGAIISALLWMGPNDKDWLMFEPRIDHLGRNCQVLRRFKWDEWRRSGRMIYDDSEPPKMEAEIWQGCIDENHWKTKLENYYRKWIPGAWIARKGSAMDWNSTEKYFRTKWGAMLTAKLYQSDMQAWGGHELFQINLDEGPPQDKVDEVVFRTQYCVWTFTPREAANLGGRSLVAKKAWTGKMKLPGFPKVPPIKVQPRIADLPDHIMGKEEREKRIAIAMTQGPAGQAAMQGGFFDSSPLVFNHFDQDKHVLPFGGDEAKKRWPNSRIIRGMDEGTAHPTACIWCMIIQTGEYVIYRDFAESNLSVSERCEKIIELSRNERVITHYHYDPDKIRYKEVMKGEFISRTFADSKIFKRNPEFPQDDWTDVYRKRGLNIERATNIGPAARCDFMNDMFIDDLTRKHLVTGLSPGYKLYITNDCQHLIERFNNYLQAQLKSGPNKGDFTGEPEKTGDDAIDAAAYITNSKLRWVDPAELMQRRSAA